MPNTERYLRCSVDIKRPRWWWPHVVGSVEVGLQYEDDDSSLDWNRETLQIAVASAVRMVVGGRPLTPSLADCLSADIERRLIAIWGDHRGRFIEVWDREQALTQVYQPCGMPRFR